MNDTRPAEPMRLGLGSALFLGVMLGSSGLTIARMLAVAWLMPVESFALYTIIVATAAFGATMLSFGEVEATVKSFPRLVADGAEHALLPEGRRVLMIVVRRAVLAGSPLVALGLASEIDWLWQAGVGCLFAVATAHASLVASMQRALGHPVRLAAGTALRAVMVLTTVVLAAGSADPATVLVAEALAVIGSCLISEWVFIRRHAGSGSHVTRALDAADRRDGRRLFVAYAMASAPFYLDRLYMSGTLGATEAGRYAVLALLLSGAALLVGTVVQRVGPDVIRIVHAGNPRTAVRHVMLWSAAVTALWLTGMALLALLITAGAVPAQLQNYAVEPAMLAPVAAAGVLLNAGMVEFLLLAADREPAFQRAAGGFLVTVLVLAGLAAWLNAELLTIMWLLVLARTIYLALLLLALPWRDLHRRDEGHDHG